MSCLNPTKALSIRQPWAWCIVTGRKPVENRDWRTNFRGRFLIHTGKSFDIEGYKWLWYNSMIPRNMAAMDFERGGIVGEVRLVACVDKMNSPWFFGKYGFLLEDAKELPFKTMKGRLGFFNV